MQRSNRVTAYLLVLFLATVQNGRSANTTIPFPVGVVLDLATPVGKNGMTSISMAIEDFYRLNSNYATRVVLHSRDSKNDVVQAAASVLDLLENTKVQAIIGPQKSAHAIFLSKLADEYQVPLLSFSATSPSISSIRTPYFVRTTLNDSCQVSGPLASIIKAFGWKKVVPIYEDTDYGRDIITFLVDALQGIGAHIAYRSVIPPSPSDDQIMAELYKLMTMDTRVFVVHMSSSLGTRLFSKAKEAGMMSQGYVWIMTDGLTRLVDSFDPSVTKSMQGSLGMKLYVPKSKKLDDFTIRWTRRFLQENPNARPVEPSIFDLLAYDTAWALAIAAEKVGITYSSLRKPLNASDLISSEISSVSANSPKLLKAILEGRFTGLSGQFSPMDRQVQSTFQIINVVGSRGRGIGFWTSEYGISRKLNLHSNTTYSTSMTDLNPIIWPGESIVVPKGWENPVKKKKLRIGVPMKNEFQEFVKVETDPLTNAMTVTGYCIDVFEAVIKILPYAISYDYIPYEIGTGKNAGTYNDLVHQVYLQKYDAVVGDVQITINRSIYVDFTLPYTQSAVSMIVPVKISGNKNMWIFLKPLTMDLWLASFAFFCFTGFIVWAMEHRINDEFRGPFSRQLGTTLYFAFSMLVFAHRERVESILSKIVVIVSLFVILILTSSYTANLSSMLTVQQFQPTVTDVHQLQRNGDYVGFHTGSYVEGVLKDLKFDESKIRAYGNPDEYAEALSKGSHNGGIAAMFHNVPYIKLFLEEHCTGYTMVGPIQRTAGIAFVFPKGSPLVPDISRAILNVTQGETMVDIEKKWFGDQTACLNKGSTVSSNNLSFHSFWGLFLFTGTASTCALLISQTTFFYKNWHEMKTIDPNKSFWEKLTSWFRYYNSKDINSYTFKKDMRTDPNGESGVISRHDSYIEASVELHNGRQTSNLSYTDPPPQEEISTELESPSVRELTS